MNPSLQSNMNFLLAQYIPSLLIIVTLTLPSCNGIRCYSDHSGPNSAGGIERCDNDAVCSLARIIYREDGVLRKATARQCVGRTPDRMGSEWPWCTEEWAGGDEGGMEVLTCFCNQELCNDNNLLRGKLSEWTATTMARLKAGPTHVLDIMISVATGCVIIFFFAVVAMNIPWRKLCPAKEAEENNEGEKDQSDEEEDHQGEEKREKED
jgi:hypothetical protein